MTLGKDSFIYRCGCCKSLLKIPYEKFAMVRCPNCKTEVGIHTVELIKQGVIDA